MLITYFFLSDTIWRLRITEKIDTEWHIVCLHQIRMSSKAKLQDFPGKSDCKMLKFLKMKNKINLMNIKNVKKFVKGNLKQYWILIK